MSQRVLICGGREYTDAKRIAEILAVMDESTVTIVHGGARGADRTAGTLAEMRGFAVEVHPAKWNEHGRSAGHLRNQAMLDTGIDLVVAFPGGRGTADMVNRSRQAGVRVIEVR